MLQLGKLIECKWNLNKSETRTLLRITRATFWWLCLWNRIFSSSRFAAFKLSWGFIFFSGHMGDSVLHLQVSPISELMTEATHWVFFWSVFMSRWTTFLNGEKRGAADAPPSSCNCHPNATLSPLNFGNVPLIYGAHPELPKRPTLLKNLRLRSRWHLQLDYHVRSGKFTTVELCCKCILQSNTTWMLPRETLLLVGDINISVGVYS